MTKSKCSYIFKALIALVLALLMVFGTVATSMAAVADDLADSGAEADIADSGADMELAESGSNTSDGTALLFFNMSAVSWWIAGNSGDKNYAYFYNNTSSTNAWSAHSVNQTGNYYYVIVPSGTWEGVILTRNDSTTAPTWSNKWNQTGDITWTSGKNYISSFSENSGDATLSTYQVDSTASLSATKTSMTTAESSTLTPSLASGTNYNVLKSTSYSVTTNPGSAGSVTSGGVFTASAAGTYVVTATVTYNAKGFSSVTKTATATKTITVTAATTPSITSITPGTTSLKIGETTTITTVLANTSSPTVTYSSSDGTVLSVTKNSNTSATVKALKPGSATITATLSDSGTTATKTTSSISVATPALSFSYDPNTILTGGNTTSPSAVTATNVHSGVTPTGVTYSVTSGSSSGSVNSSTGVVTSTSTAGTVTVKASGTVTYNSVSYTATGTATVTVNAPVDVYFKYDQTGSTTTKGLSGTKMTYDNTSGLYKYSVSLSKGSGDGNWYYIVIYDAGDAQNLSYNNGTLTETLTTATGFTIYSGDNNVNNPLHIVATKTGTYNFYYNADTNKLFVECPHTVTFNANGHGTAPSAVTTAYNTTITAPTAPTAEGYTFGGWYKESTCTNAWNFSTDKVTEDRNLYAKWTAESKTLTVQALAKETSSGSYNQSAASITSSLQIAGVTQTTKSVTVGTSVTVTAPATDPSGYVFKDWYDGSSTVSSSRSFSYTMPTTAKTLTARYDRKYTLTISKATNNGTVSATSKTVYYGDAPGSFTITPNSGYRIKYADCTNLSTYYTTPSGTTGTQTMTGKAVANIAAADRVNKTITVAFEAITPTVTFGGRKTDDGSAYSDLAGAVTAAYASSGSSSSDYYVWYTTRGDSYSNPTPATNYESSVGMTEGTDGFYYAKITNRSSISNGNTYLLINNSSTNANAQTKWLNGTYTLTKSGGVTGGAIETSDNYDKVYLYAGTSYTYIYLKLDTTSHYLYASTTDFSYTPASGSGGSGSVTSGSTVTYNSNVTFTALETVTSGGNTYRFAGWYSSASPAANATPLGTDLTYTKSGITDDYAIYAVYDRVFYITLYNSYKQEANGSFTFIAAPPRTVTVGDGTTARATYTYAAGTAAQRGEEHTVSETGTYYEGNKLEVRAGETVTLNYSGLTHSEAISGVFFNNELRYSTELEPDNMYLNRAANTGTFHVADAEHPYGYYERGDDDWNYTYLAATTIKADANYYSGTTATTISSQTYTGSIDQSVHRVTWTASQNYYNIDLELAAKYRIFINDSWTGLNIENINDEAYYSAGEVIESTTADHTNGLKISLDTTDTTSHYRFTSATAAITDENGDPVSGVTVKAYTSSNAETSTASSVDHFLIYGTMPAKNIVVTIPIVKEYTMRLSNIVVSDTSSDKRYMLTETSGSSVNTTTNIGTITAVPTLNGTAGADISSDLTDSTKYYNYPADTHCTFDSVRVFTTSNNNHYLNGGVNKGGTNVEDGSTVTYTFAFANGYDTQYSFVGWFEGSYDGTDQFTVDYSKKLSGKLSFTYTPTKDTVIIAVGTRDLYLGGNFTNTGAYTATSAQQTWASNRILMSYDPTYVNPSDSTKRGRYYYTFDTVTANTEYQFRCYDTVSSSGDNASFKNLTVWNTHLNDIAGYKNDDDDIADYRSKYDSGTSEGWTTHGGFMYTTATGKSFSEIKVNGTAQNSSYLAISKNHQADGYAAPVTVYFYPYDSGISVDATYIWGKAYVSAGRGIYVTNASAVIAGTASATFNTPSIASVAGQDGATVTTADHTYGTEAIKICTVKTKDGKIRVTVNSGNSNVDLQGFVVYNINTKEAEGVTDIHSGASANQYYADITIPSNTNVYICPVYKFTDTYMATTVGGQPMEQHDVYVSTEGMDKSVWGGLVAMYSWGTTGGLDSGGWPGQLLLPSDDGKSFYGKLQFVKGGLAGVTMDNYFWTDNNGTTGKNFISLYSSETGYIASSVKYNTSTGSGLLAEGRMVQNYDYREPISIIENIDNDRYEDEDMDLTFALKTGNKSSDPTPDSSGVGNGSNTLASVSSWQYLTDRSGKYRVDLLGNKILTDPTATYRVVCMYTREYKSDYTPAADKKTYDFKDTVRNEWSVDWYVYDNAGNVIAHDLSASFTDINADSLWTVIGDRVYEAGEPVSGKAVQIAYENPAVFTNTGLTRYSGQWYADGVNSLIDINVRVGIYSDGAYTVSGSNAAGYGTATVSISGISDLKAGEETSTEDGCTGASKATVIKKHASDGKVTLTVSTTTNFLGWFRSDGEGGYEPVGSNYKNQSISPSFNSEITYYAFYSASATYRFAYTSRLGGTKYYTAKGYDLTDAELETSAGHIAGVLDASARADDIADKLAKATTDITKFNKDMTFSLSSAADTSTPYQITYTATEEPSSYTLTPYAYNAAGTQLVAQTAVSGNWNTPFELPQSYTANKPSGHSDYVFIGWVSYTPSSGILGTQVLSTQANFGYCLTGNMTIAPWFGTTAERATARSANWIAGIDKNMTTQELTDANNGTIFNDSLISFRYGSDTGRQLGTPNESTPGITLAEGEECGIVLIVQANTATAAQETSFTGKDLTTYTATLRATEGHIAKMKAATYGEAYAMVIPTTSLSSMNRANLYQYFDYAKFNGGNYKVASYYYNGSTYTYSTAVAGTLSIR